MASATTSTATDTAILPPHMADEVQSDTSKLKIFISILRKFIGVADLASVRFSLPSQLLEPTPNLEYWNYLDAPNAFVAIGTSEDPLDRMLEVLRFVFTKDVKYVKGKVCKPYNSCLGEFFRCNWETEDNAPKIDSASFKERDGLLPSEKKPISLAVPQHGPPRSEEHTVRVSYLTEQTSHHPPISAFCVSCPEKGLSACGFDQISAKFTGTSIKVLPGEHNLGVFISLEKRGETYQMTHPAAHLGGLLRGRLTVSVVESSYITCPKTKLKAILNYYEDGWLTRSVNKVDGVVFRYDPENDTITNIKDIPENDILVRLNGSWRDKINFTLGPNPVTSHPPEELHTLIDLNPLVVAPKILPPTDQQLPNESLTFWSGVTEAIHDKQFGRATTIKNELEEAQREKARERERLGTPFKPVFFLHVNGNGGQPELTDQGREVLQRAQKSNWSMEGII